MVVTRSNCSRMGVEWESNSGRTRVERRSNGSGMVVERRSNGSRTTVEQKSNGGRTGVEWWSNGSRTAVERESNGGGTGVERRSNGNRIAVVKPVPYPRGRTQRGGGTGVCPQWLHDSPQLTLETKVSCHQGQCIPAGCRVTLLRRTLIAMSIITMLFSPNSASVCLRFAKSRPQFCESCVATYRRICKMFSALQSTSSPVTDVVKSVQIDA